MKAVLSLFFTIVFVAACGRHSGTSGTATQHKYIPLSLEDSKILITPTLYYIPDYDQTSLSCASQKTIKDDKGKKIVTVCKNVFDDCLMQGTCQVRQGPNKILLNVGAVVGGERRFTTIKNSICVYGTGSTKSLNNGIKTMCLDPNYSVAADLEIYSIGTVIHVSAVEGMTMPDGSIHDGNFIVRDSGGAIKGYGRFDFFSGFSFHKAENPLAQIGLGDKSTNLPYTVIEGDEAVEILKKRNFPSLPIIK